MDLINDSINLSQAWRTFLTDYLIRIGAEPCDTYDILFFSSSQWLLILKMLILASTKPKEEIKDEISKMVTQFVQSSVLNVRGAPVREKPHYYDEEFDLLTKYCADLLDKPLQTLNSIYNDET